MFWILSIALLIIAALFVLSPLWLRGRTSASTAEALRKSANVALFQERCDELEADLAAGEIDQAQFDSLLVELQQGLLADVRADTVLTEQSRQTDRPKARSGFLSSTVLIPVLIVLAIPLAAYSLYDHWGYRDDVALMGLFQRTVNNVDNPQESQSLIVSLGEIVRAQNDLPWAWYFLAENFASLGMFKEAEIAYVQSATRMEDSPEKALVLGRVALAKYINAELKLTPEIDTVIEQARAINPNEVSILQLLAADAEQRQDYRAAIQYWRLLIQSNPNSDQARILRDNIAVAQAALNEGQADVAPGPAIDVTIALAEGIELSGDTRVFVAVRNAEREGMPPLAATQLTIAELPTTIRLDDADAVGAFNLSSAETVYVTVLVSFAGSANPQSGDYRVVSNNFAHNGQHTVIELTVSERIP